MSPEGVIIQDAFPEDIDELEALEKRCFPEEPWTRGMLLEELRSGGTYFAIAREKGRITGYICAWIIPPYECQIGSIAVLPECRRKGIAAALLNGLIESCEKAETDDIYLEVRVSNTPAIALYESFGFEIESIRKRYYQDGEDAYNMARLAENVRKEDRK